jgi:hypothetical protein
MAKKKPKPIDPSQMSMQGFVDLGQENIEPVSAQKRGKKLIPDPQKLGLRKEQEEMFEPIPELVIKTRWERLEQAINKDTHAKTIIRPVPDAIQVISRLIMSVRATNDCKILVIKADSGTGKTTFLNTLDLYIHDHTGTKLTIQTIDLFNVVNADDFSSELRQLDIKEGAVNIVVLEGKETPGDIDSDFIDGVISRINRFSRNHNQPMLVVIPTNEDTVAKRWVSVAAKTGGLSPTSLPEGQTWYDFPGVPRNKYIEIAEETIRILNSSREITDFGISASEMVHMADMSDTIGAFLEALTAKNVHIRTATQQRLEKRTKVWVVFCCPDRTAYDQLYSRVDAMVLNKDFRVSPEKLISSVQDNAQTRKFDNEIAWPKLLHTLNFLDIRVVNLPIVTMINAALAFGDEELLNSFKTTPLREYRKDIPEEMWRRDEKIERKNKAPSGDDDFDDVFDWDEPLNKRRRQSDNVRDSLRSSNLFFLLRNMPGQGQKGGNKETSKQLAQFLHLMDKHPNPLDLHYYIGMGLKDLLTTENFPGYLTVGTETPYIQNRRSPVPDVAIYTEECDYLLEFHFSKRSLSSSELARYVIQSVIQKYMDELPVLKSLLEKI